MKKYFILMSLAAGILILSCKKDKKDNEPEPVPTEVASAVIGSDGGTLQWNTFELIVPPSSFTGTFNLTLLEHQELSVQGVDEASVFYTVHGLPVRFSEPLKLSITPKSQEDGSLFLVLGEESRAVSQNVTDLHFRFEEGTMYEGKYTVDILPVPGSENLVGDTMGLTLGLVRNYTKISSKGQFEIFAPASLNTAALQLMTYLDEAYTMIQSGDLAFSYARRTNWPVKVNFKKLDNSTFGNFVASKWGNNYGFLEFNSDKAQDLPELRITAGHEFFHLIQALYDPRSGFVKAISAPTHLWLEEASSVWLEERFANTPGYCSPIRNGHQLAPFEGMEDGAVGNQTNHGYGMSALIKYIESKFGIEQLAKIFGSIFANQSVIQAIDNNVPEPLATFYPDFINEYILGNIYSDMSITTVVGNSAGEFESNNTIDTLKVFESEYPGLSVKAYKFKITHTGFDEQSSLAINTFNGTKKLIYKIKSGNYELLGTSLGEFVVNNLSQLQQENAMVVVVVVHQYYTTMTEKLEFKIRQTPPAQFNSGKFSLSNVPAVRRLERLPEGTISYSDVFISWTYDNDYRPGTYQNGVYTANWSVVENGWTKSGSMVLHIDETNHKITNGEVTSDYRSNASPLVDYKIFSIKIKDVAATGWGSGYATFGVGSNNFCDLSKIYDFQHGDSQQVGNTTFVGSMDSYSCQSSTSFGINLKFD
ncbi:MAG: hypothetical protein V1775_15575 [Bacteroidota bacterium]